MIPRQKLERALEIGLEHTPAALSLHEANLRITTGKNKSGAELIQEALKLVKSLAIGRWVSVDERLPEESGCYLFAWEGGEPQWIDYTHGLTDGETPTHWLDLSMPES